jgi:hypothetical protein
VLELFTEDLTQKLVEEKNALASACVDVCGCTKERKKQRYIGRKKERGVHGKKEREGERKMKATERLSENMDVNKRKCMMRCKL